MASWSATTEGSPGPTVAIRPVLEQLLGVVPRMCKSEPAGCPGPRGQEERTSKAVCAGIDVSQAHLDLAVWDERTTTRYPNTAAGQQALCAALLPQQPQLVVLEATGGYEDACARALAAAGIPVAVVNPQQTHHFARSCGQRAKSDALDAQMLARYAAVVQPPARPLPAPHRVDLDGLRARRQQRVEDLAREKARLRQARPVVQPSLQRHIEWLEQELQAIDRQLDQRIAADAELTAIQAVLEEQPGIGRHTARTLIAALPELGRLSGKEIAALAGLAPFVRQSGRWRGEQHCSGGRVAVKTALYQAALSARRYHPVLAPWAQTLKAAGKRPKVYLTAVARRLLVRANAAVRDLLAERAQAVDAA